MLKKMLCVASVCTAVLFAPVVSAQSTDVATAAEQLRVQMVEPTEKGLDKLVLEDLSYGHSSGRIDTKSSFIGDLMKRVS